MAELKSGPPKGENFQAGTVPYFLVYLDCSEGENPADDTKRFRTLNRRFSNLRVPALEAGTLSTGKKYQLTKRS